MPRNRSLVLVQRVRPQQKVYTAGVGVKLIDVSLRGMNECRSRTSVSLVVVQSLDDCSNASLFVAPPRTFHTGAPRPSSTTINTFGHCRPSVSDTSGHRWAEVTQFEQDTIFPGVNDPDLVKM